MDHRITDLSFEEWILFIFCWPEHPHGSIGGNRWYTDEWWQAPPAVKVDYMTRLWENSVELLEPYSDREIAQGLWDIVGDEDYSEALSSFQVPLSDRLRCIDAFVIFFRDIFVPRCTDSLEHLSETGNPLNTICYMWWDLLYIQPAPPERAVVFEAIVRSQTSILHLSSTVCQEAALHGFGHWLEIDAVTIQQTIDHWLLQQPHLRPELRNYAQAARCGCIA